MRGLLAHVLEGVRRDSSGVLIHAHAAGLAQLASLAPIAARQSRSLHRPFDAHARAIVTMRLLERHVPRWKTRFEHVDQRVVKAGVMIRLFLDRDLGAHEASEQRARQPYG